MSDSDFGDLDQELLALGGEEEEEEGEASSVGSPHNSLGSGAMSESESDTSPGDAAEDAAMYPLEGKYVDEKDRADIMALPEIKREEILARRAEEVERLTQDIQLRRMAQIREREELKAAERKKRKAGSGGLDDVQRKSSRQKKASDALESYRKQREQRGEQRKRQSDRRAKERFGSPSSQKSASSRDAEGESEVEWDGGAKSAAPPRDDVPAELQDFNRARVGRSNFARYCFYPRFQEAIVGCPVRVNIGVNKNTGAPQYRLARITGFAEGRPYRMENPENGRPFMVDQYASLTIGKSPSKEFPFNSCSDQKINEDEFEKYQRTLSSEGVKMSGKLEMTRKVNDINNLINTPLQPEDIERRLAMLQKYPVPAKSAVNRIAPNETEEQQRRLQALNAANRKANVEGTRKALIAERRAQQRAREVAREKAELKEREEVEKAQKASLLQVPNPTMDDLFEGSDRSRSVTPNPGKKAASPQPKPERKGIPTFKKRNMDDDLIAAMDLGIEIDI